MDDMTEAWFRARGFFLDTCLRQIAVMVSASDLPQAVDRDIQWYTGTEAYCFLLQTATGLNSPIPGETNILGQFKQAWSNWRKATQAEQVCPLHTTMHRLFADSRDIRRKYLQGIGGNSYGSLVRKLLQPHAAAKILFVGGGKLTQSMTSLFGNYSTGVWNHRPLQMPFNDGRVFCARDAKSASEWATHFVLTIPASDRNDRLWSEAVASRNAAIVHLGRRRAEPGVWANWQEISGGSYFNLDDVFDLRQAQFSLRSLQIHRARKACEIMATTNDSASLDRLPQLAHARNA
jgi:hypothetical protein